MTQSAGEDAQEEVLTFTECVIGYRAWSVDSRAQLWPLSANRHPWQPGINTARCHCAHRDSLQFDWTWHEGRRVLEPVPAHAAPDPGCECGLYSWRRPRSAWRDESRLNRATLVCGAVASWGKMQVHRDGFRAEHACIVTLAFPQHITPGAFARLEQVAERYRVELVAIAELEPAASRHGSPLPESVVPPSAPIVNQADSLAAHADSLDQVASTTPPAPDATIAEVTGPPRPRPRTRVRHVGIVAALALLALLILFVIVDHRTHPCHLRTISVSQGTIEECVHANSQVPLP